MSKDGGDNLVDSLKAIVDPCQRYHSLIVKGSSSTIQPYFKMFSTMRRKLVMICERFVRIRNAMWNNAIDTYQEDDGKIEESSIRVTGGFGAQQRGPDFKLNFRKFRRGRFLLPIRIRIASSILRNGRRLRDCRHDIFSSPSSSTPMCTLSVLLIAFRVSAVYIPLDMNLQNV